MAEVNNTECKSDTSDLPRYDTNPMQDNHTEGHSKCVMGSDITENNHSIQQPENASSTTPPRSPSVASPHDDSQTSSLINSQQVNSNTLNACNKKCILLYCTCGVFIVVISLLLLLASVSTTLLFTVSFHKDQQNITPVRTPSSFSLLYKTISRVLHGTITVAATDDDWMGNITVAITPNCTSHHVNEIMNSTLDTGPYFRLYSFDKFEYTADVIGNTTGSFNVSVYQVDIYNKEPTVNTTAYTLNKTLQAEVTYTSSDSGYFSIFFDVPSNLTGIVVSRVSYKRCDLDGSHIVKKCTILNGKKPCDMSIPPSLSDYQIVAVLQPNEGEAISVTVETNQVEYLAAPGLIITTTAILIIGCCVYCKFKRKSSD